MDKKAKIYVAGHTGLVGSALVRKLNSLGYTNLVLRSSAELDLRSQDAVQKFFAREKPDVVFLAAARVGGILANNTYRAAFIYDNLMIAANVINAAYSVGVQRLLNLGSSCIYPRNADQPLREDSLLTGALEQTNEPYAIAKIAAIKLCDAYNRQYGTKFLSAMPTNLYGPNDNFNLETSHVLPGLIRKFILARLLAEHNHEALMRDVMARPLGFGFRAPQSADDVRAFLQTVGVTAERVLLWGTGNPRREFLHVDDLAEACVMLIDREPHEIGEMINIGTGKDLTVAELASMIGETAGFQGEIVFDRTHPDGTPRKLLDVSRISALGWKPTIPLRYGIESTIRWYFQTLATSPQSA
ncbi:MAG: GDP-L-fucose synthase [Bacteroidia bacterium]|nr:MAG: GDP-L-fucose synthase [Bacteroidia bacterium]